MYLAFAISFVGLLALSGYIQCQSKSYVRQIYRDLFSNYTKQTLPVLDHSRPLEVGIDFYLQSIQEFSEIGKTMTIIASFNLNWTDPFLVWDPALYGNTTIITADASDMWTPPIMLTNTAEKLAVIGGDTKFYANLFHNGQIFYAVGDVLKAKCEVDISKFPFDEQNCNLFFAAYGLLPQLLNFSSYSEKINLNYFLANADWNLEDSIIRVNSNNFIVSYDVNLKIKRSSLYYVVMVIAPTLLFAVLNPLVFMLPIESGERIGLAMTILLSYAIFLTIVSSSIPASSNPMCVLLIVMVAIIFISGIIVFGVILSVKYFNQEDVEENVRRFHFPRICIKSQKTNGEKIGEKVSGKDVSNVLDSVFFYGSYIVMITTFAVFAIYTHLH